MAFKKGESGNKAGRPKGATTKPRITDYLKKKEIDAIVAKAKELALAGDQAMIKLIIEQNFGKAAQAVELSVSVTLEDVYKKAQND